MPDKAFPQRFEETMRDDEWGQGATGSSEMTRGLPVSE